MAFELKVSKFVIPEKPEFNYDELKQSIGTALAEYDNVQFLEGQEKELSETLAKIRKLKKALNDERIARKKEWGAPFEEFEAKMKEISAMLEETESKLKKQEDEFEEKRKAEKAAQVSTLFNSGNYGELPLDLIWNEKLLNKGMTEKKLKEYFDACFEKFNKELAELSMMECSDVAISYYKKTLDKVGAQSEALRTAEIKRRAEQEAKERSEREMREREERIRLEEQRKAEAEAERIRQEERRKAEQEAERIRQEERRKAEEARILKEKAESECAKHSQNAVRLHEMPTDRETERKWARFQVLVTMTEFKALHEFCVSNGIKIEPIKKEV